MTSSETSAPWGQNEEESGICVHGFRAIVCERSVFIVGDMSSVYGRHKNNVRALWSDLVRRVGMRQRYFSASQQVDNFHYDLYKIKLFQK